MKPLLILPILLATSLISTAAVKTEPVEYKQGDTTLEGWLVYDDAGSGKRPGVLVVHDWFGVSDYVKGRAEQLAKLGYVAFVADIYGKGVRPQTPKDARGEDGKFKGGRAPLRARVNAALDVLKSNPNVDPARIAAIGYCFGGTTVLELARSGADTPGIVTFHRGLHPPPP